MRARGGGGGGGGSKCDVYKRGGEDYCDGSVTEGGGGGGGRGSKTALICVT